jgi:hypothetical protein
MGRRAGLSTVLIMGAVVLLISIAVGNSMGNRVLGQIAARAPEVVPTPMISASADPGGALNQALSVRHSVLSVATDPGFPDPRVTPEPSPVRTPPPAPKRTPTPKPSPEPSDDSTNAASEYTSPPLPIPIVSHDPGEISDPNGEPLPSGTGPQSTPPPSSKPTPP